MRCECHLKLLSTIWKIRRNNNVFKSQKFPRKVFTNCTWWTNSSAGEIRLLPPKNGKRMSSLQHHSMWLKDSWNEFFNFLLCLWIHTFFSVRMGLWYLKWWYTEKLYYWPNFSCNLYFLDFFLPISYKFSLGFDSPK